MLWCRIINGASEITLDNKEYKITISHALQFISQNHIDTEGSPSQEGKGALACEMGIISSVCRKLEKIIKYAHKHAQDKFKCVSNTKLYA